MHQSCTDFSRAHAMAGAGLPAIEPGMPTPAGTGMSRRSLMLRSLGLGVTVYGAGALGGGASSVEAAINDAMGEHKVLVSVFLEGGLDGLSTLMPLGSAHESRFRALRPTLSKTATAASNRALSIDPSLFWHPSAAGLQDLWNGGAVGVALAPAVGYGSPSYSHFTSRHFWEVGAMDVGGATGWMGRYLDRVGRPDIPIQGLSVGYTLSPTLATKKVPIATVVDTSAYKFTYPAASGWVPSNAEAELRAFSAKASGDTARDQARLVAGASLDLVGTMSAASAALKPTVAYPSDPSQFVDSLKTTAQMLDTRVAGAALPIRCVALRGHGDYDTHSTQEASFAANLKITSDGIKAFWADLKARGEDDRVVMLVWSEFGRRPQENGSLGSDHGAAGMAFVIGKSVKQGLIGEFPGLKAYGSGGAGLMQDGNLRATSDFRGIYSSLLEQWLGTDADGIIPGAGARPGFGAFARPTLF